MDSILPRLIRAGSHHAAIALATHDNRLVVEFRFPEPLYGYKKVSRSICRNAESIPTNIDNIFTKLIKILSLYSIVSIGLKIISERQ